MFRLTVGAIRGRHASCFDKWTPFRQASSSVSESFSVTQTLGLKPFPKYDSTTEEFRSQNKRTLKPDKELDLKSPSISGDTFGDVSESYHHRKLASEYLPDDDDNYDRHETFADKKHPIWYQWQFKELIERDGKAGLKRALELYNQMKVEDGFCPEKKHFTYLLKGCAQAGYTEKAFQLFEELLNSRDHNYTVPTCAGVTSLFNAAANGPFPEYGLEKAKYLRNHLQALNYSMNQVQYHAMIKAYGKCGDLMGAFQILDEMAQNKVKIDSFTFGMLLVGCAADKESGLGHAVKLLRRMRYYNISRTIHQYNVLLTIVRDCKVGSVELIESLVHDWDRWDPEGKSKSRKKKDLRFSDTTKYLAHNWIPIAEVDSDSRRHSESNSLVRVHISTDIQAKGDAFDEEPQNSLPELPNLLSPTSESHRGQVIGINLNALGKRMNRLSLLGGMDGILSMMTADQVKPNLDTMLTLLDIIPHNLIAERSLMERVEIYGIDPDIRFFNKLIKRVVLRGDVTWAKPILEELSNYGLTLNESSFGNLALGCKTFDHFKQLVADMNVCGIEPNYVICTTLLRQAIDNKDFWFVINVLNLIDKYSHPVFGSLIESLETLLRETHDTYADFDHGRISSLPPELSSDHARKAYWKFSRRYRRWMKSVKITEDEHPWKKYHVPNVYHRKKMDTFERVMRSKIRERFGNEPINSVDIEDGNDYHVYDNEDEERMFPESQV